jgi:hypothetical protein
MIEFSHRVKVFVYDFCGRQPTYLLVRSRQGIEGCWGPLHGPIGLGDQMETAIRRAAMDELGIGRPAELIDLQMPSRWVLGDEEVIEWNFGFRVASEPPEVRLDERWEDFRWEEFGVAYPTLELEPDRAAILRLHTLLSSN